jgi:RNA methyltransferase, TrmH family
MPVPPVELVTSRHNALVKRLRGLKDRGEREDVLLIEGPKLLEEAARSGVDVLDVAASPRGFRRGRGRELLERLEASGTRVHWLHEDLLASLSETETSQGLLAVARRPWFAASDLFRGTPLVVVAVGVQNPGNLGALLRTAEAAGATGALLTEGTADPFSWKSLRGSMGSAFRLPHLAGITLDAVLRLLEPRGVLAIATDAKAPLRYDQADLRGPVAFLFGNEGAGLPPDVVERTSIRLRIPIAAPVESLNVGVAAGILLFEAARQRRP